MLERAGNRTLAVQAGVLREVVAMHLSTVVTRTFDRPDTQDQFRKLVRSYRKLVLLIDARDAEGAERHWRTHMEVIGRKLLRDDMGAKAIVDLFGWRRPARLARPARLTPARPLPAAQRRRRP